MFKSVTACAVTALLLSACGGGVHDAMRPEPPTAAEATERVSVKAVEGPSAPLVVDWKAEQRADLEEAIHDGIAVVAWHDDGLKLLRRCHLKGSYGYLPVQVKKDVVRLESADEVAANLPLGGLGIVGKIGGEFKSGTTLDIALAMVGKRRTTWNDVAKDDLEGDCGGATHYVRAILVGAFAMKTGSRAKAAAAVEIFGAGTSGSSASSKDVSTSDGRLEACEKSSGDESQPPNQCAAILRLELEPIQAKSRASTDEAKPDKKADKIPEAQKVEGCPPGLVFSNGACKLAKADVAHTCAPTDAAACEEQCNKGDAASCDRLGTLIARGKKGPPDLAAARGAFEKGCSGGYANACTNLGLAHLYGTKDIKQATTQLEKGCIMGSARACEIAGEIYLQAKDVLQALHFFVRGCDGGDFNACTNAGFLYSGGGGAAVQRDDKKALAYAQRACFGGNAVACGNAGYRHELGTSVPANPKLALALYERACKLDSPSCFRAGLLLATGAAGVPKDEARSKQLLERSCRAGRGLETVACIVCQKLYGAGGPPNAAGLKRTVEIMTPQCDQKDARACSFLGIAEYGAGRKPEAAKALKTACGFKDPLGCELAKKLR